MGFHGAVAGERFAPGRGQDRAAAAQSAFGRIDQGFAKAGVHGFDQEPAAAVAHAHAPAGAAIEPVGADGAPVRLFNDRASVALVLRVGDEVQPGIALVPGQRPDDEALDGTVNLLCSDRFTDLGDGATYQGTFLDVTAG